MPKDLDVYVAAYNRKHPLKLRDDPMEDTNKCRAHCGRKRLRHQFFCDKCVKTPPTNVWAEK